MERKKLTLKIMLFFIVFSSYTILHKPSIQYKFNNEGKNALKWDEREGKKGKGNELIKIVKKSQVDGGWRDKQKPNTRWLYDLTH